MRLCQRPVLPLDFYEKKSDALDVELTSRGFFCFFFDGWLVWHKFSTSAFHLTGLCIV